MYSSSLLLDLFFVLKQTDRFKFWLCRWISPVCLYLSVCVVYYALIPGLLSPMLASIIPSLCLARGFESNKHPSLPPTLAARRRPAHALRLIDFYVIAVPSLPRPPVSSPCPPADASPSRTCIVATRRSGTPVHPAWQKGVIDFSRATHHAGRHRSKWGLEQTLLTGTC